MGYMKCPPCDFDYPSSSVFSDKHEIKSYLLDPRFKAFLKKMGLE
jgi:hypothetical protein